MRPLRYSINITLDGCCDHEVLDGGEELHRHAAATLARADALIFGRVTYEMMLAAFGQGDGPTSPDPFARTIDAATKHVVSSTLTEVGWNSELLRGDLGTAVSRLKEMPGRELLVGGVRLPLALASMGLIDEYELVVHPVVAGRGPTLFSGLPQRLDLVPTGRDELGSGAVATRYVPRR